MRRLEEIDKDTFTGNVVRGGHLECFAALCRAADDVGDILDRRARGQRRIEGAEQLAEDVLWEAFIVLGQGLLDERQPDLPPCL